MSPTAQPRQRRVARWLRSALRKREREPCTEYRARVCNKGSIFGGGEPTPWTTRTDCPRILAMIERAVEDDIPVLDYCPWPAMEWELHQRHLLIEERANDA